jgi:hypothetical protein
MIPLAETSSGSKFVGQHRSNFIRGKTKIGSMSLVTAIRAAEYPVLSVGVIPKDSCTVIKGIMDRNRHMLLCTVERSPPAGRS